MAFLNMTLRGLILSLSLVCFFFQSEAEKPNKPYNVIMVAVFGAFAIISFGLLVDTTLNLDTDRAVVVAFLATGAVCFSICLGLSANEFDKPQSYGYEQRNTYIEVNKTILSTMCVILFLSDIGLVLNTKS